MNSCPKQLISTAVLITLLIGRVASAGDPDLEYFTIKTEHFNIHFHQGLERVARQAASLAEEIHDELTVLLGWEVDGPTEMVINDSTDSANGSATSSPRPIIRLFATAPDLDSSLAYHDHWLRTLITHEYTHVVHLQMHDGLARVINAVFGDVYLPNFMQPRWFIEGLAVLDETYQTSVGRIRSNPYRMTLRAHALDGKLLTLGELSNPTRQFPRGSDDYIYGAMFLDYLRGLYGTEKIVEICHRYGAQPIPYGMNRIFSEVLGQDLVSLYRDWIATVKEEAEQTARQIRARGETTSRALTSDGEYKGRPVFAPDSQGVILAIGNGEERSGIFRVPLDGGPRIRLALSGSRTPISIDRSGRLFYTRAAPYKNNYFYRDLFVLEEAGADPRRLTVGARVRGVAVSPGGAQLAVVLNDAGTSKLVLADEQGNTVRTLIDSAPDDQVYDPAFSPDGKRIAVVVRQGPQVDLILHDLATAERQRMSTNRYIERSPTFDPTGRYLVFSSDRGGVANIYAFDLRHKKLVQLTNVVTGAFGPAVSPDGKHLAFLRYSALGHDLHVIPFDVKSGLIPEDVADEYGEFVSVPPLLDAPIERYNPLPSMLPRHWMLGTTVGAGGQTVIQAVTAASDAVGRHRLGAELDYGIQDTMLSSRIGYAYGGLGPGLHLGLSRRMEPRQSGYTVGGKERPWTQEILVGRVSLSLPIFGVDRHQFASISYSVIHAQPDEQPEADLDPRGERPTFPRQYFRAGLELDWSFSNTVSSPFGISPEAGRILAAGVDLYHPALGGRQTMATFRYRWSEYLEAPWLDHHVFALRLNGGFRVSNPPGQAAFAVGGYAEQNVVDAILNRSYAGVPTLRGYPPGAFLGESFHSLKLEYRFPVWLVEAAYETLPLFLRHIQGGVFSDNVLIGRGELGKDDWRSSVGGELVWVFYFGYYMPLTVSTGYAYGLMEQGIHELILVLGGTF